MRKFALLIILTLVLVMIPIDNTEIATPVEVERIEAYEVSTRVNGISLDQTTPVKKGDVATDFELYDFYDETEEIMYNLETFDNKKSIV